MILRGTRFGTYMQSFPQKPPRFFIPQKDCVRVKILITIPDFAAIGPYFSCQKKYK